MSPCTRVTVAAILSLAAPLAQAGVISPVNPGTVGTGIECEFGSIQSALNAAAAAPGPQTIYVTRMIPYTNQALVVNDAGDVTLIGGYPTCFSANDGVPTVLAGSNAQSVVRVTGTGNVTLRQLDIGGGGGSVPPGATQKRGGGVLHVGSGMVTVENSRFSGNLGYVGSAISVTGTGSLRVLDSELHENGYGSNTSNGVVLHVATTGTVLVRDTSVLDNKAGVRVDDVAVFEMENSTIAGTEFDDALLLRGNGAYRLDNVTVEQNQFGGIAYDGAGSVDLHASHIRDNGTQASSSCTAQAGFRSTGGGSVLMAESTVTGNCGALGGGIFIDGGSLSLDSTRVADNVSWSVGGGITARRAADETQLHVRFGADTVVENNRANGPAGGSGGGVYLENAELDATQAPGHAIRANIARDGGGLYLLNSTVRIGSGQAGGSIADNQAEVGGGGMYLTGNSTAILYTTDPDVPAGIVGNSSGSTALGGGISAYPYEGSTNIFVFDARIVDNVAPVGGGVSMVAYGDTSAGVFCMGSARRPAACADLGGQLPADAKACRDPSQCNLLQGNRGDGVLGGAAMFRASGGIAGAIPLRLVGARVVGNTGRSIITSMPADNASPPPTGAIEILDSVIAGNTATNALFDSAPPGVANFPADAAFAMGPVRIERSTIAGNGIGTDYVIGKRLGLVVHESIVYQPFLSVHAGNPAGIDAHSVIVENGVGLPPRADIVLADPLLTDAANGDVRPLPGSPAIDFSSFGAGGFDVDGIARGQDAAGVPNRFGERDIGAHEVGVAFLFRDGFEGAPLE